MDIYNAYGSVGKEVEDTLDQIANEAFAALKAAFPVSSTAEIRILTNELNRALTARVSEEVLIRAFRQVKAERA